jgi:hypothetical protein
LFINRCREEGEYMDMPEPSVAGYFGVKYATLLAGFAGGVVSLSYMRELSRLQMVLAVVTGALLAGYLTPLAQHWISMPNEVENGVAFLLGLTAMNIVPGFLRLAERFKNNPEDIFKGGQK